MFKVEDVPFYRLKTRLGVGFVSVELRDLLKLMNEDNSKRLGAKN